jgi:hypothetical protein
MLRVAVAGVAPTLTEEVIEQLIREELAGGVQLSCTVPVNPLIALMVMVELADCPGDAMTTVAFRERT